MLLIFLAKHVSLVFKDMTKCPYTASRVDYPPETAREERNLSGRREPFSKVKKVTKKRVLFLLFVLADRALHESLKLSFFFEKPEVGRDLWPISGQLQFSFLPYGGYVSFTWSST